MAVAPGVEVEEDRWPAFVAAATLTAIRSRAARTAPEAHLGMWAGAEHFFRSGGTPGWAAPLTPADLVHFRQRMSALAGDAAAWATGAGTAGG